MIRLAEAVTSVWRWFVGPYVPPPSPIEGACCARAGDIASICATSADRGGSIVVFGDGCSSVSCGMVDISSPLQCGFGDQFGVASDGLLCLQVAGGGAVSSTTSIGHLSIVTASGEIAQCGVATSARLSAITYNGEGSSSGATSGGDGC